MNGSILFISGQQWNHVAKRVSLLLRSDRLRRKNRKGTKPSHLYHIEKGSACWRSAPMGLENCQSLERVVYFHQNPIDIFINFCLVARVKYHMFALRWYPPVK
jgi:hypothetical protein